MCILNSGKRSIASALLILMLGACGGDSSSSSAAVLPNSAASNRASADAEKWNGSLEQLLTPERAGRSTGRAVAADQVERDGRALSYRWDSARTRTLEISGFSMEVPVPDEVELGRFSAMSLQTFQAAYRTPTQEELAQAREAVRKRMEEAGVSAEVGGAMFEVAAGGAQYAVVEDLGDAAAWNPADNNLAVLIDGLKFELKLDVGEPTRNREGAISLAREILTAL